MARTRMFGKNNQRGITWKVRKGEQLFLCATRRPDIKHIPVTLYEDIPDGYCVLERTSMFTDGRTAPCHNTSIFFKTGVLNAVFL